MRRWKVEADSIDVSAAIERYLESITVTDDLLERADQVDIAFCGGMPDIPAIGTRLRVWMLGLTGMILMGAFRVDEPEIDLVSRRVTIRGRSIASSDAIRASLRRRTWDNMGSDEIVTQIALSHGYRVRYTAEIVRIPHMTQFDESDAAFLRRLAARVGAQFSIKNDSVLMLSDMDNDIFAVRTSELSSPSTLRKTGIAYKSARCGYHDTKSGVSGFSVAGKGVPLFEGPSGYDSAAAARGAAASILKKHKEGGVSGTLSFDRLRPEIYAGATIVLAGCDHADFNTTYKVKQVRHTVTPTSGQSSVEV